MKYNKRLKGQILASGGTAHLYTALKKQEN